MDKMFGSPTHRLTLWSWSHSVLLHTSLNLITGSSCFRWIYFSQWSLSDHFSVRNGMQCLSDNCIYCTRVVGHSELNWECILNSNLSPECMFLLTSELVLSCRCLGIVSLGALRCHENNELEFENPETVEVLPAVSCPVVCVSVWEKLEETACVSACFLHLQYQPCWSNIWEQSCQFQQWEKQR